MNFRNRIILSIVSLVVFFGALCIMYVYGPKNPVVPPLFVGGSILAIIMCVVFVVFNEPHDYIKVSTFHTGVYHKTDDMYVEVTGNEWVCTKCGRRYETLSEEDPNEYTDYNCKLFTRGLK